MDWSHIIDIVLTAVILPGVIWGVKTLIEIKTILIGTDGQNGIRSDIKILKDKADDHEHRITIVESRVA